MLMNPEVKAKWVEALRSGNYVQGQEALVTRSYHDFTGDAVCTYCCLGVLQTLYPFQLTHASDGDEYIEDANARHVCGLEFSAQEELARMNDSGVKFPDLADYIDANL